MTIGMLQRAHAVSELDAPYDVLVIGGGATGVSVALDSATRGYKTILVTSGDFAQGTSSRSTKLIHGGVRYLQLGDLGLVREALHERGLMLRNAPHLVRELRLIIPAYSRWQLAYYGAGLKLYDVLASGRNLTPSRWMSRRRTLGLLPMVRPQGLKGAVAYSDGQFNDARLVFALARTAQSHGAVLVNYASVTGLLKRNARICGAALVDDASGQEHRIRARGIVNATGIFADDIRRMDDPSLLPVMAFSRGSHVVVDRSFLPGDVAILVPRTEDGRVVFIIPWEGRTLIGTTEVPVESPDLEPVPGGDEIDFLLHHAALYLARAPHRADILSAFAGIRPLVRGKAASTAKLSRDHAVLVSDSGLVTITGGKWTTCRRMAEDAVNRVAEVAGLPARPCATKRLPVGRIETGNRHWQELGAGAAEIEEYERRFSGDLHPRLPYTLAMAAYVIECEMPLHLDDVLSRRLRALLLDASATMQAAPRVASLMATLTGRERLWVERELKRFAALASRYLVGDEAA